MTIFRWWTVKSVSANISKQLPAPLAGTQNLLSPLNLLQHNKRILTPTGDLTYLHC